MSEKVVSWFQINNWIPLIGSCLALSGVIGGMKIQLARVEEKLDRLVSIEEKYKQVETRLGYLELDNAILKTIAGLDKKVK
jgi:hypothetical protein